jgi:glycosyltransferase involved in cell wall biosynthesis
MLGYFGNHKRKEERRTILTKALRLSPLHRHWLKRMSFVLAANRDTLQLIRALGCKNAGMMCDAGLPDSYFAQQPRTFDDLRGTLKLLWVGRMLPRKALPLALDALRLVQQDVTLTIAADGMEPEAVHQMIRERNLQGKVFWKGSRLPWDELRTAYAEHDAMLFTSLRDSFGSQLLEAMAMGLPVITLDLHGAHDHVPAAASIKVQVGKLEETIVRLANAIEEYSSYSSFTKNEMSKQAWRFAKTLSWSARAESVESLYHDVLSRVADVEKALSGVATARI